MTQIFLYLSINGLNYLLRTHTIDIVLGDFNINYFSSKERKPECTNIKDGISELSADCKEAYFPLW